MKYLSLFLLMCFLEANQYNYAPKIKNPPYEKKLVICVASYNNQNYYKKNLDSIFSQNYSNFRVLYVEDASTDNTYDLVATYIKEKGLEDKITLIHNSNNQGPIYNQYHMIHSCDDDEIIVTLDGDDWFAHNGVLTRINQAYHNKEVWVTYGQFKIYNSTNGGCRAVKTHDLVKNRLHRKIPFIWSHTRTFYAGLFKKIPVHLFQNNEGEFFPMAGDVATMLNLIDMAPLHTFFMPEVSYIYNMETPLNQHKKNDSLQSELEKLIKSRPPLNIIKDWRN